MVWFSVPASTPYDQAGCNSLKGFSANETSTHIQPEVRLFAGCWLLVVSGIHWKKVFLPELVMHFSSTLNSLNCYSLVLNLF